VSTFRSARSFSSALTTIPAFYIDAAGRKQFRKLGKYARAGMADILAVKEGKAIFLEAKSEVGKVSPNQEQFEEDATAAGARYHVIRSIDDVQKRALARIQFEANEGFMAKLDSPILPPFLYRYRRLPSEREEMLDGDENTSRLDTCRSGFPA
jgi:hypothetical protein